MTTQELDTFTLAYIDTALWTSTDASGAAVAINHGIDAIHPDILSVMVADCEDFQQSFGDLIPSDRLYEAGHDFWLTRNHHGAGFWDGDWAQPMNDAEYRTVGDHLTAMAHAYGEFTLYIG